jgi:probable rRNA maturation factor
VKITIRNLQETIPINPKRIKDAVLKALSLEKVKKSGEITVCFLNDREIKELNLLYLAHNIPTDVIAFDISQDKKRTLADIAISTDTAIRNARLFKTSPLYEIYLYVIHGVLHILGYDDQTIKGSKIMEKKANLILTELKTDK